MFKEELINEIVDTTIDILQIKPPPPSISLAISRIIAPSSHPIAKSLCRKLVYCHYQKITKYTIDECMGDYMVRIQPELIGKGQKVYNELLVKVIEELNKRIK